MRVKGGLKTKGASRCWAFLGSIWIEAKCEISQAFLTFFAQKINEMIQKIKDFFSPLTTQEQEERYLKLNGYPKETVTFSDRNGRLTQLIGSNIIIETYNNLKMAGFKLKN